MIITTELIVRLEAKRSNESAVAAFLRDALPLAHAQPPRMETVDVLAARLPCP